MSSFWSAAPTTYSVTPVEASVATWDVTEVANLRVEVANLDGSQTVACRVRSRAFTSMPFSPSERAELSSIGPGETAGMDVACGGAAQLELLAASSGVGCDIQVAVRRAVGR